MQPTGDEHEYLAWDYRTSRNGMSVHENQEEYSVKYPSHDGKTYFRTIFRRKPRPIGFHANL